MGDRPGVGGAAGLPPMAALVRRPAMLLRRRVMTGLSAAGHDQILPAHLGVFQHPGPDGLRPGELAARTFASKQAMNHLLNQLEGSGYLLREPHPEDRRIRVVRLTDRGWAALEVIRRTVQDVERQWAAALDEDVYRALRHGLARLEEVLDVAADAPPGAPHRANGGDRRGMVVGRVDD